MIDAHNALGVVRVRAGRSAYRANRSRSVLSTLASVAPGRPVTYDCRRRNAYRADRRVVAAQTACASSLACSASDTGGRGARNACSLPRCVTAGRPIVLDYRRCARLSKRGPTVNYEAVGIDDSGARDRHAVIIHVAREVQRAGGDVQIAVGTVPVKQGEIRDDQQLFNRGLHVLRGKAVRRIVERNGRSDR